MVLQYDKVMIYTDGGSRGNPGPSAIGILIYTHDGKNLEDHREFIGEATNNQAEYSAVLKALDLARQFTKSEVYLFSDSQLLVNQLSGDYKVKNPALKEFKDKVKEAEKSFVMVSYIYVTRREPRLKLADMLVNKALDAVLK
jgi:ribonuclease HI